MCRGCVMTKNGEETVYEYLSWNSKYFGIITSMKALEKEILEYQSGVDSDDHKKILDAHRRRLIRLRREYAKSDQLFSALFMANS